jgi:hypothetical protein
VRARGFLEFLGLGLGAAGYGGVETGFREGTASLGAPSFGTGINIRGNWGERRGLNPRPSVPQTDALPAELRSPSPMFYWLLCATADFIVPKFVPKTRLLLLRRILVKTFSTCSIAACDVSRTIFFLM